MFLLLTRYHYWSDNIIYIYLVGGLSTPLKNMSSSVGMIVPFPI